VLAQQCTPLGYLLSIRFGRGRIAQRLCAELLAYLEASSVPWQPSFFRSLELHLVAVAYTFYREASPPLCIKKATTRPRCFLVLPLPNQLVNSCFLMDTTRDRILALARETFYQKGFAGARMQEIADAVGINKAMLHYYFKTKDHLFATVFEQALEVFLGGIARVLNGPLPLRQKLSDYVDYCLDTLQANPAVAGFILHELHQHPERLTQQFAAHRLANLPAFRQQVIAEAPALAQAANGADHLFVNMIALCVYPVLAQPLLQPLLEQSAAQYQVFLQERKQVIKQQLLDRL
jgi:TetR/AcrR family transcriptional regulator